MNQYQIKTPDIAGSYLKGKDQRRKEDDYQQDKTQKAKARRRSAFKYAYEKMYEPQGKKLIEEGDQAGVDKLNADMKSKWPDEVEEFFGGNLSFDVKAKTGTSTVIIDSAEDLQYFKNQGLIPDTDYNFHLGNLERGEKIKLGVTRKINGRVTKIEDLYEGDEGAGPKAAKSLRTEFFGLNVIQNSEKLNQSVSRITSVWDDYQKTPPSDRKTRNALDQTLITSFNKILDPTSVVRESEYNRFGTGLALDNRLQAYWEKTKRGGVIIDEEREDIVRIVKLLQEGQMKKAYEKAEFFTELANRQGIDPYEIVGSYLKQPTVPTNAQPQQNTTQNTGPSFFDFKSSMAKKIQDRRLAPLDDNKMQELFMMRRGQ